MIQMMTNMINMLAGGVAPGWYAPIRVILLILIVLISLFMILVVLLQPGNTEGLGAISGSAETFFGKNKAKTLEGRLRKLTVVAAIALIVLCITFAILSGIKF